MAHGSPRINICLPCKQYTLVSRFDSNPTCPNCKKESTQASKEKIMEKFKIGLFSFIFPNFGTWTKIK